MIYDGVKTESNNGTRKNTKMILEQNQDYHEILGTKTY